MTSRTHARTAVSLIAALLGLGGCASTPAPPELSDARSAYLRAESGPAAQLKPDQLHEAKVALDRAEQSYADDPGAPKTRDLAYVAARRAELADVQARDAKNLMDRAQAEKDMQQLTQSQLASTRQELSRTDSQLAKTSQQLTAAQQGRMEAEKRAKDALDKLAASAAGSVKQETRGTVITIPGSVLFPSAKWMLLPAAQTKLAAVADALKDQEDHSILVEGHTDSQGTDAFNQELSENRARAVKEFLTSHGVPADRIKSQGLGPTRPVADNKTVEGRASNRRVEIIVQPIEPK